MKRIKIIILLFLFSTLLIGQTNLYRITTVGKKFVRPIQRELPYYGKVYPPLRKFDNGSEYLVTLEIVQVDGTIKIDNQLTIICFLPDLTIQKVLVIPERIVEQSSGYFTYSFPLQIFIDGWIDFGIINEIPSSKEIDDDSFSYVRKDQKIYLYKRWN